MNSILHLIYWFKCSEMTYRQPWFWCWLWLHQPHSAGLSCSCHCPPALWLQLSDSSGHHMFQLGHDDPTQESPRKNVICALFWVSPKHSVLLMENNIKCVLSKAENIPKCLVRTYSIQLFLWHLYSSPCFLLSFKRLTELSSPFLLSSTPLLELVLHW